MRCSWVCLAYGSIRLILPWAWSSCDENVVNCASIAPSVLTSNEKILHVKVRVKGNVLAVRSHL